MISYRLLTRKNENHDFGISKSNAGEFSTLECILSGLFVEFCEVYGISRVVFNQL